VRALEGVRDLRERRMLTQQELADRAAVSLFTVQRIERGEGAVRPKTGRAIAEALGVRVEALLGKAQAPLPDFEDERREYTADELLEDFRRQVRENAKAGRRLEASEGTPQTYFSSHYNAGVEKLSRCLPANLVGPIADVLQGFVSQEQKIAQLEAEVARTTDGAAERTAKSA
jgi:transcriptional regulator with XRE-family HTH domain